MSVLIFGGVLQPLLLVRGTTSVQGSKSRSENPFISCANSSTYCMQILPHTTTSLFAHCPSFLSNFIRVIVTLSQTDHTLTVAIAADELFLPNFTWNKKKIIHERGLSTKDGILSSLDMQSSLHTSIFYGASCFYVSTMHIHRLELAVSSINPHLQTLQRRNLLSVQFGQTRQY